MISLVSFLAVVVPFSVMQIAAQPAAVAPKEIAVPAAAVAPVTEVASVATPAVAAVPVRAAAVVAVVEAVEAGEPAEAVEASPVSMVSMAAPVAGEAAPAVESTPATVSVEAASAVPAAAATAPLAIPILRSSDIGSRPFRVLDQVEGRSCTLKLGRAVNTGDPSRNPAEALATQRLLQKAAAQGADAVTNLKCVREIRVGLSCPTAVACEADAIRFE